MQAYEGYFENGHFYPAGQTMRITGRRKVIMTVLDEPAVIKKTEEMTQKEYQIALDELCGSIDDPTFIEPPEIPWEFNTPREEIR